MIALIAKGDGDGCLEPLLLPLMEELEVDVVGACLVWLVPNFKMIGHDAVL